MRELAKVAFGAACIGLVFAVAIGLPLMAVVRNPFHRPHLESKR